MTISITENDEGGFNIPFHCNEPTCTCQYNEMIARTIREMRNLLIKNVDENIPENIQAQCMFAAMSSFISTYVCQCFKERDHLQMLEALFVTVEKSVRSYNDRKKMN